MCVFFFVRRIEVLVSSEVTLILGRKNLVRTLEFLGVLRVESDLLRFLVRGGNRGFGGIELEYSSGGWREQ